MNNFGGFVVVQTGFRPARLDSVLKPDPRGSPLWQVGAIWRQILPSEGKNRGSFIRY